MANSTRTARRKVSGTNDAVISGITGAIQALSPSHWWKLDESAGVFVDSGGLGSSAYDGTGGGGITRSQTGPGDGTSSVLFNGSSGIIDIGAIDAVGHNIGTGDFSLIAYVKRAVLSTTHVFYSAEDNSTSTVIRGFLNGGDNYAYLLTRATGGGGTIFVSSNPTTVPASAWRLISIVRSSGSVTVYSNTSAGTPTADTHNLADGSMRLSIGYERKSSTNYFNGNISNVAIWEGVALSAGNVATLAGLITN